MKIQVGDLVQFTNVYNEIVNEKELGIVLDIVKRSFTIEDIGHQKFIIYKVFCNGKVTNRLAGELNVIQRNCGNNHNAPTPKR